MTEYSFPIRIKAIRVKQQTSVFYAAAIPADLLLEVCFSDKLQAKKSDATGGYTLVGAQRDLDKKRLREIGAFLGTLEAGFPNSIILAANFRDDNGLMEESNDRRWRIEASVHTPPEPLVDEKVANPNPVELTLDECIDLIIPTPAKLAAIIDGQHRLFGFTEASLTVRKMPVLCSIFVDLPKPYQAHLFATINSTQKQVNRSMTYELFGYNLEEEEPVFWSPDKLAVYLARRLNTDQESPLVKRILVAPQNDVAPSRSEAGQAGKWMVSMAAMVDGILGLISTNPKKDGNTLRPSSGRKPRSALGKDTRPLRGLYLNGNDKILYACVRNFFHVALSTTEQIEDDADASHPLTKTIGIQALFDLLRELSKDALQAKNFSEEYFNTTLAGLSKIDFTRDFELASGSARTTMRNVLMYAVMDKTPERDDDGSKLADVKRYIKPAV